MNKQVNLLPDTKQTRLKAKRLRQTIITASIIALAIAIGVPVLLLGVKGSQILYLRRVQSQIDERQQIIRNTPDIATILTVKDHLNSLPDLYTQRLILSELLGTLPTWLPQEIRLSQIEVDTAGLISFSGSSPSYAAVEKFHKALAQAGLTVDPNRIQPDPQTEGYFTNVALDSASGASGSEVIFIINANFNNQLIDGAPNG